MTRFEIWYLLDNFGAAYSVLPVTRALDREKVVSAAMAALLELRQHPLIVGRDPQEEIL